MKTLSCGLWDLVPCCPCCSSVTKLFQTLCDPSGLQHARLLCPPLSPSVCSNSCPLSWWCYLTILYSVAPFSSCLQSFPASWSLPISWLFASGGQSIRASDSAPVLPMNIQGWFPLGLTDLISLQKMKTLKSLLRHHNLKASILLSLLSLWASLIDQMVKNMPAIWESRSIPGLGRPSGEGNGNPLQYSCLENSMDRGAWQTKIHGVAKSWTWLNN